MNFKGRIFLGGLVLCCAITLQSAESLSVRLQKGIYAEETEGNLDAAITIYESILKETEGDPSVAAQAQYRLGMCQMKRGKRRTRLGARSANCWNVSPIRLYRRIVAALSGRRFAIAA